MTRAFLEMILAGFIGGALWCLMQLIYYRIKTGRWL